MRAGKSPLTIRSYQTSVAEFKAWWLAQTTGRRRTPFNPRVVSVHDVRAFRGHLVKDLKAAPATVNRKLSGLVSYFRVMRAIGIRADEPTEGVHGIKQVRTAPCALERKDINRLLRFVYASHKPRDIAILELLLNTGLRVGELVHLSLDDITINERSGAVRIRDGKGGVFRCVPLNADVRRCLRHYLTVRPANASSVLFLSQKGAALASSSIWRIVKKYGERAELKLSPHVLRHTFGTRMVREQKADLALVAKLMGHQDVNTTVLYAQPTDADLALAVEGLAVDD